MSNEKKPYVFRSLLQWYCDCASPTAQRGKKFKMGSSIQMVCKCGKVILKKARRERNQQTG